ncbi:MULTISPECIES: hypothetical protein [unclassified Clostridioides]
MSIFKFITTGISNIPLLTVNFLVNESSIFDMFISFYKLDDIARG